MELWIRSQDRNILEKVNKLYITTYDEQKGFGIYDINYDDLDDCDIPLAFYKTKERALEVLDEIEKLLMPKMIIKNEGTEMYGLDGHIYRTNILSSAKTDIQELPTYVYKMPKE